MSNTENREPLMKIRHLTKEFKIKSKKIGAKPQILHALSDVSLDVYEGETLGIIGESGCGKSTLGRTIIQLHKATAGSVEYQGKNLFELKGPELKKMKKDIQMVFQDPYSSLDPRNTCEDIIAEPLKVHGLITDPKKRQERVLALMREVGLDIQHNTNMAHLRQLSRFGFLDDRAGAENAQKYVDLLHTKTPSIHQLCGNLSGGNQQKVVLAKWLCNDVKVLIVDEPTRGIDVGAKYEVYELFNRLSDQGVAIIMISSELPEILGMSDRILVIHEGGINGELDAKTATQEQILYLAAGYNKLEGKPAPKLDLAANT